MRNFPVRKRSLLVLLVLLLTLALAALPSAAQASPEDVAKAFIAAVGSNNVDAATALFANDAVVRLADGSTYSTPADVRAWQQALANGHFRLEPINMQVDGNNVSWTGNISLDTFRNLGIATLNGNWKLNIDGGKIKIFDFTWTPDALTTIQNAVTISALVTAEASHDVDTAVAQFAPDAVVNLADGSHFDTTDGIRAWQQLLANEHFHLEPVAKLVDGNTVMMYGEIGLDRFRAIGITTLGSVWKIGMENGKIKTFDFSWTDEGLATLQAAVAALATPEATASS